MNTYLLTLSATGLLGLGFTSAANIAMNGDFETGDTTGWTSFPSATSTFVVTTDAHAGTSAGQLTNVDSASAAIIKQANLGAGMLTGGDAITVSFWAKGSGDVGGVQFAELFSEISGGGVSSSEILGGAPLFATSTYSFYTFTTTLGANVSGGVTLQLAATTGAADGSTSELFIDNVVIDVATIPEPASGALVGLAGLLSIARRRR